MEGWSIVISFFVFAINIQQSYASFCNRQIRYCFECLDASLREKAENGFFSMEDIYQAQFDGDKSRRAHAFKVHNGEAKKIGEFYNFYCREKCKIAYSIYEHSFAAHLKKHIPKDFCIFTVDWDDTTREGYFSEWFFRD